VGDLDDQMAADAAPRIAPGDNALRSVSAIAEKAIALEDEISALEELMKRKVDEYRRILEHQLPEAMKEVGLTDFSVRDGSRVETKIITRASPPADKKAEMYKWLRDNKLGDLIKTEVSLSFPAGREKDARVFLQVIAGLTPAQNIPAEFSEGVHANTLTAFVKRRLADGKPLPLATFGVWQGEVAKITRPKA